mmetsp:Transcript_103100/g.269178  ORF Transcript_103100/g.269178 Transcript_103100/m.269178 type:complete len:201 (-) Transcript_103100:593-1195(-)
MELRGREVRVPRPERQPALLRLVARHPEPCVGARVRAVPVPNRQSRHGRRVPRRPGRLPGAELRRPRRHPDGAAGGAAPLRLRLAGRRRAGEPGHGRVRDRRLALGAEDLQRRGHGRGRGRHGPLPLPRDPGALPGLGLVPGQLLQSRRAHEGRSLGLPAGLLLRHREVHLRRRSLVGPRVLHQRRGDLLLAGPHPRHGL